MIHHSFYDRYIKYNLNLKEKKRRSTFDGILLIPPPKVLKYRANTDYILQLTVDLITDLYRSKLQLLLKTLNMETVWF